jgi:hypothetical protein
MLPRTLLSMIALTLVSTSVQLAHVEAQLAASQPDAVWHFKATG